MTEGDEQGGELRLSRRKELLFRLLASSLPLLLLGVAELMLRLFDVQFDPYLHLRQRTSVVSEVEIDGQVYLQVTHPEAYSARGVRFLAEKPPNTLRILCFGGSASAGWPHPGREIYSAYLEGALAAAYPDREIEVVNLSAHAHASYRVRAIFQEAIDYDPDLVVIYSGNNEFLERRSYWVDSAFGRGAQRLARRSRVIGALRSALAPFLPEHTSLDGRTALANAHDATMSFVHQTTQELRSNPVEFESVKAHYSHTIRSMVERAGRDDVPVVLVTVPVNLSDWVPHVSANRLTGGELERWQSLYVAGRRAELDGEPARALDYFDQALELEPEHAETRFRQARALEALGRDPQAAEAYIAAKDLDQNPFRAISAFNETLRRIAVEEPSVSLLDAERLFLRAGQGAAPGFDLFLDYVHPSRRGNRILARGLYQLIVAKDLLEIGPPAGGRPKFIGHPDYRDANDMQMQVMLLWLLGMSRQEEALLATTRELQSRSVKRYGGMTAEEIQLFEDFMADIEAVIGPRLEMIESEIRGVPVPEDVRERIEASTDEFYAKHYASGSPPWRRSRVWPEAPTGRRHQPASNQPVIMARQDPT